MPPRARKTSKRAAEAAEPEEGAEAEPEEAKAKSKAKAKPRAKKPKVAPEPSQSHGRSAVMRSGLRSGSEHTRPQRCAHVNAQPLLLKLCYQHLGPLSSGCRSTLTAPVLVL